MKREKIQGHKKLLLIKKGEKTVWGGDGVRDLLGLPDVDMFVEPGNHGDYDIFVLSTSVNRKLVRGTTVLLDKTKSVGVTPTWDHNAAAAVALKKRVALAK